MARVRSWRPSSISMAYIEEKLAPLSFGSDDGLSRMVGAPFSSEPPSSPRWNLASHHLGESRSGIIPGRRHIFNPLIETCRSVRTAADARGSPDDDIKEKCYDWINAIPPKSRRGFNRWFCNDRRMDSKEIILVSQKGGRGGLVRQESRRMQ